MCVWYSTDLVESFEFAFLFSISRLIFIVSELFDKLAR